MIVEKKCISNLKCDTNINDDILNVIEHKEFIFIKGIKWIKTVMTIYVKYYGLDGFTFNNGNGLYIVKGYK